jgi:hypothetical protein
MLMAESREVPILMSQLNFNAVLPGRSFLLNTCLAYSLTLKMEAVCSIEMLVNFYWTTWH